MFYSFYVHCMLICFINAPRFQIYYNCIVVSRYSPERINQLLIISYDKYCFTFRTDQMSTRFLERITFVIQGSTVFIMIIVIMVILFPSYIL